MTEAQKKRIESVGLDPADFQPKADPVTVDDLVDAINVLTDIVLGGESDD